MPHPGGFRGEGDRPVSHIEIRAIGDEEDPVDTGEGGRQRRTRLVEVAHMESDLITEERLCLLRVAHENGRSFATGDQALGDSGPDVPRRAEDQILHVSLLQPLSTSSANRF